MAEKEVAFVQLTENYRITSDKLNIILQEKYDKRVGRGKNAEFSGEIGWRDAGYFTDIGQLGRQLVKREIINFDATQLDQLTDKAEKLKNDIKKYLTEHITLARDGKKMLKDDGNDEVEE